MPTAQALSTSTCNEEAGTSAPSYQDALKLARQHEYDAASAAFEGLLSRDPGHAKAWISYAQLSKQRWMRQGSPSLAHQACGAVLERGMAASPQAAGIVQAAGLLRLQQGDGPGARALLERAVALEPRLAPVLGWKAVREAAGGAGGGGADGGAGRLIG
ncbi:hypothetical protein HYH03_002415 [Edaphochlamys debaryana]|uniref:Uncharacterized protein n=1 Tax=Edaphochlamys debaryana TaxID=47281 RepID=A0A836C505_9CHLO|nr:hypothetical protein HYH03_002415 [Edaphochlamys debaryana]|eukprot:KAG2499468.1 hypothetical protein HYH03_002415 [Edaphochlamys debaryana]